MNKTKLMLLQLARISCGRTTIDSPTGFGANKTRHCTKSNLELTLNLPRPSQKVRRSKGPMGQDLKFSKHTIALADKRISRAWNFDAFHGYRLSDYSFSFDSFSLITLLEL